MWQTAIGQLDYHKNAGVCVPKSQVWDAERLKLAYVQFLEPSAMSVTSSGATSAARTTSSQPPPPQLIAPSLLVSLAAAPCVLAIVAMRAASELLERVGQTSEEIFRGDRLPVIHVPSEEP
jgi:hypothetical protein